MVHLRYLNFCFNWNQPSITQLFSNHLWVARQSSGSFQAIGRQSSGSHQGVVGQSSGSCQAVFRQSSNSRFHKNNRNNPSLYKQTLNLRISFTLIFTETRLVSFTSIIWTWQGSKRYDKWLPKLTK